MRIKKIDRNNLLKFLLIMFVITLLIIGINKILPQSKADPVKTIQVTYKSGDGTGEDVTTTQTIYGKQTQGSNDYTNNKIVLYQNGDTTSDSQTINFDGGTTQYQDKTYQQKLTGWKLTAVYQNGTKITQVIEPELQDYANPKDAAKDIDTVYAQKGWYIVPEGVTAIEVTAVYGRAIYIRSPFDKMYYDEYHIWYYGENNDGTTTKDGGTAIEKSSDSNFGTSPEDAISTLKRAYELMTASADLTVYDTIFMLCGDLYEINYNTAGNSFAPQAAETKGTYKNYSSSYFGYNTNANKPVTISSEYGKKYNCYLTSPTYDYTNNSSLRLDNIDVYSLQESNVKDKYDNDIVVETYTRSRQFNFNTPGAIFETTETATAGGYCQIRYKNVKYFRLLGGGWNPVWNYGVANGTLSKGNYIQIGGLALITYVTTGSCYNSGTTEYLETNPATLVITGGKITTGVYGTGNVEGSSIKGNVNIFVSGGNIANIYGAGKGSTYANGDENGDVNITIYGGTIGNIYGAGQFYTSNVSGNVNLNISNATITESIYGGGKGGKVTGNVSLLIDNCTIEGTVFGGGYGLTDNMDFNIRYVNTKQSEGWDKAVERYNSNLGDLVRWEEAPKGFPVYNNDTAEVITRKYHSATQPNGTYSLYEYGKKASLTLAQIEGKVKLNIKNSNI